MQLYRAEGALEQVEIDKKRVVLVGLGSLGSAVAAKLAYEFGQIVLIDPEVLEPENVERHWLDKRDLGRAKVRGIASKLVAKGVSRKRIRVHQLPVEEVLERYADADLVIDTTAELTVSNFISRTALAPAIFAWVRHRGRRGEVVTIPNKREVCWTCAALRLRVGEEKPREQAENYGVERGDAQEAQTLAIPALRWVIDLTASLVARQALQILEGRDVQPQLVVYANSWETLARYKPRTTRQLSSFVRKQERLGMVPHLALGNQDGVSVLSGENVIFPFVLTRWESCPFHSHGSLTAKEI